MTSGTRIVYVHGFVQHSLAMDQPLETFIALNGGRDGRKGRKRCPK